jgi:hypothetical protein
MPFRNASGVVDLTEPEKKRLEEHIDRTWKNGCSQCGHRNWQYVGITQVALGDGRRSGAGRGIPALPSAAFVCMTCGNTILLNLYVTGVLPQGSSLP